MALLFRPPDDLPLSGFRLPSPQFGAGVGLFLSELPTSASRLSEDLSNSSIGVVCGTQVAEGSTSWIVLGSLLDFVLSSDGTLFLTRWLRWDQLAGILSGSLLICWRYRGGGDGECAVREQIAMGRQAVDHIIIGCMVYIFSASELGLTLMT